MKNPHHLITKACLILGMCFFFIPSTIAQHGMHGDGGDRLTIFDEPIELFPEALGKFSMKISTENPEAQSYFDQGIQLKYSFAVNEAAKSFREAQKRDPNCAICYWGEAWALGSYLNGKLNKKKAPYALAAIRKADSLKRRHASPLEKDLIKAMKVRYVEDFDEEKRPFQDTAYAKAMRPIYEKYPNDLDVATIYAEALFLLEPRRGTRDMDDPDVMRIHKVLEGVLDTDITHPGACHLYIHATESTTQPELGASCAEYLGDIIPGASHMNHMPSHTYNEIGLYGKSVRANIQASHSDQKAKEGTGGGIAIYPSHNLHMLLFSASMDGQSAIALQAARDFSKMTGNTVHEVLTLIRFGRFDEVLEVEERPKGTVAGGIWDFAQGYAHLKTGEQDFARVYAKRVITTADTASEDAKFRFHPARKILGVLSGILLGEIYWEEKNYERAIATFEQAVAMEDSMAYDEPEPIPFFARHWLGASLLELGEYEQAEEVYRAELEDHARNGWSLFGLIKALEGQEKDANAAKKEYEESWQRADYWIRSTKD